jgi:hypothetical protein
VLAYRGGLAVSHPPTSDTTLVSSNSAHGGKVRHHPSRGPRHLFADRVG